MSVRVAILFLLVMVGLALLRGPAFRRSVGRFLGLGSHKGPPRRPRD